MSILSQIFPPKPTLTEHNLPDQSGRVFIVTGSAVGVGYHLAQILYGKNGTIYIATRSESEIRAAIESLKNEYSHSKGRLGMLVVDLLDLSTIKPAANQFLAQEQRPDVLVHNAGVMIPPKESVDKFRSHRVVGISHRSWHSKGGIVFDDITGSPKVPTDQIQNYMQSKVGNVFLAHEWAKSLGPDGRLSISVHPGLIKTELQRHSSPFLSIFMGLVFKPARYGAYTELFAGLSSDLKLDEHNGGFIIPWGRHGPIPDHLAAGLKTKEEGGTGLAQRFFEWCDKETKAYQ